VDITLNVNWDQYTYANNTRTFESHNGQLYANISHGDDFFWAPELYYNNDYVRMRDELSVYWDYEYHKDARDLYLILTEEKEE
jgi:hypothetical protein